MALAYALKYCPRPIDNVLQLSVGTAAVSLAKPNLGGFATGVLRWLLRRDLVTMPLTAQERLSVDVMDILLGEKMTRIDAQPSAKEEPYMVLDRADAKARGTLNGIADRVVAHLLKTNPQGIERFFQGEPLWLRAKKSAAAQG